MKDINLSADEAARIKEEQAARLRDIEKKVRALEQDLNQSQEVSVCVCVCVCIFDPRIHQLMCCPCTPASKMSIYRLSMHTLYNTFEPSLCTDTYVHCVCGVCV